MSYKTMNKPARPAAVDRATSPVELWKMFEAACEQNEQMLAALKLCATLLVKIGDGVNPRSADAAQLYGVVRAAITKAEGNSDA